MKPSEKFSAYKLLFVVAIIVFALDQLTKTWIFNNPDLPLDSYFYPDSIEVIKGFFYIVHIGNEGAAWGMFSGYGGFLALFAFVALFAIYKMRHSLELHRKSMQFAFGLLIGGVLGNMVDRLIHGHVIDFLDFHFPFSVPYLLPDGRYPAFNIADCGIVIGVFTYITLSFFSKPLVTEEGEAEDSGN
ncbi:MAG: signal peptidase II [Opitutales bacterium]|jgi:signal peptidase II|nr:signal peptidase II [Opitutales bacterium]MDP4643106.1 signal peptidase II [Opitutales bacterium]MDP4694088.1 signal peptidase II [Opitutales bacterium]MDP4776347.1 signal peptidase II [Opitutales bacterium]MDP4879401.1 signal peptidase II [Opitutales bacterium]